jgi:hypothetical protein
MRYGACFAAVALRPVLVDTAFRATRALARRTPALTFDASFPAVLWIRPSVSRTLSPVAERRRR